MAFRVYKLMIFVVFVVVLFFERVALCCPGLSRATEQFTDPPNLLIPCARVTGMLNTQLWCWGTELRASCMIYLSYITQPKDHLLIYHYQDLNVRGVCKGTLIYSTDENINWIDFKGKPDLQS